MIYPLIFNYYLDAILFIYYLPYFFNDKGPYHIEVGSLLCKENQWAEFYMIGTFIIQVLRCESEKVLERY